MSKTIAFFLACWAGLAGAQTLMTSPTPPLAPQLPYLVKSLHGDRVDEYHWLRDDDPKAKRPEVMRYLEAENAHTDAVLAPLAGLQRELAAEMRARIKPDESSVPVYDHGWWVWTAYEPAAEYPRLMRQRGTPEGPDAKARPEVLLDLPARAAGQPFYKLGAYAISPDGRLLAWTEDTTGRRIHTLRVRNLATSQLLDDAVPGVLEDLVWSADSRSLFYVKQDPVLLQSGPVFRHALGTAPAADTLVYEEADKTLFTEIRASASRRYLLIDLRGGDIAETRAVPLARPAAPVQTVLARRAKVRHEIDHGQGRWFIMTNEGAVNFKLVTAAEGATEVRSRWRTLVPGREQATVEGFVLLPRGVAVQERVDADRRVRVLQGGRSQPLAAAPGTSVSLGERPRPAGSASALFGDVDGPAPGHLRPAPGQRRAPCCASCARCPPTMPPATARSACGRPRATASASRSPWPGAQTWRATTARRPCWSKATALTASR